MNNQDLTDPDTDKDGQGNSAAQELLEFFKALSDENRLKIVGLLAQGAHSVEELAEILGLSASTVSHHLARLGKAGLVGARPQGHYFFYHLQADKLQQTAARLLSKETYPRLSANVDLDAYARRVMQAFTNEEGRISAFPVQEKKLLVLLRYVLEAFEPGRRYSEKQVNETLARFNEDTAFLRRSLVDFGMIGRTPRGEEYWRL